MNVTQSHLCVLFDAIPVIVWRADPDGTVEFWNKSWHEYTGLSPEDSDRSRWKAAICAEDLPALKQKWRTDLEAGTAGEMEVRLRRFDGTHCWFLLRYRPLHNDNGKVVNWYGSATEVENLKAAEQRVREKEQQFHTITDAISQYIVVLAPNGNVLYTNQAVFERTGVTPERVSAEGAFSLPFHPDDVGRVRAERKEGLAGGVPFELEVRVLLTSGEYRWHLMQYNPERDEQGRIVRWYATGTDIDARKRAEENLRQENIALREEIDRTSMFEDIVGSCEPMRRVLTQVAKVAPSDSTVLILGETGTGKELIARALHRRSHRTGRAFIRVNCAALPQSLIASELFGHEKGAFTGALQRRQGRFEAADGGTLFLDEVGDLPMDIQIALLRVLQEREIERVGSNYPISIDIRLIAATNRDLTKAVAAGGFREDLFYRLNVFPITVPPLRERIADIPALVEYFVQRYAARAGKTIRHIGKDTLKQLKAYRWPGNIRELQNVLERAVILSEGDTFCADQSWLQHASADTAKSRTGLSVLADREVEMIEAALAECHGRISGPAGAAAKLGVPRQTLESKIRKLGIDRYGRSRY